MGIFSKPKKKTPQEQSPDPRDEDAQAVGDPVVDDDLPLPLQEAIQDTVRSWGTARAAVVRSYREDNYYTSIVIEDGMLTVLQYGVGDEDRAKEKKPTKDDVNYVLIARRDWKLMKQAWKLAKNLERMIASEDKEYAEDD